MPMQPDETDHLIAAVVAGDDTAWGNLWTYADELLARPLRSPRVVGRLCQSEDDCRNIFVEVMARLGDDDFRRLRLYLDMKATRPGLEFGPWLRVVARRVAIDYMRGHGEYIDRRRSRNPGSAPGAWVAMASLPSNSRIRGDRPAYTNRGAAMKMLRYAYSQLPPDQLSALELWITNLGFADIADKLALDSPKQAERAVRAALERLRRHFREKNSQ